MWLDGCYEIIVLPYNNWSDVTCMVDNSLPLLDSVATKAPLLACKACADY